MGGRSLNFLPKWVNGTGYVSLYYLYRQREKAWQQSGHARTKQAEKYFHSLPRVENIKEAITKLRSKLVAREPTLQEIIAEIGESPENQEVRDFIPKVGRRMENPWEEPTDEEKETAKNELIKILMRVAWLKKGLEFEKEKRKWNRNEIKTLRFEGGKNIWATDSSLTEEAKEYSERYPNLIPPVQIEKREDECMTFVGRT